MMNTVLIVSSIFSFIFYQFYINFVLVFLMIWSLRDRWKHIFLIILSLCLIPLNIVISYMTTWILANVVEFNIILVFTALPAIYLVKRKKYFSAIILCKAIELIIYIWGIYGGFEIA